MQIIKLSVGDLVKLKKKHPCGGDSFQVLRVGSNVRIICQTCKRDMDMDRIRLEKSIKSVSTVSGSVTKE